MLLHPALHKTVLLLYLTLSTQLSLVHRETLREKQGPGRCGNWVWLAVLR